MAFLDDCGFCGGVLLLTDADDGWVFLCQSCGRETIYSDAVVEVLGGDVKLVQL